MFSYNISLPFTYLQCSSSILLTPPVLLSRGANASSRGCAVLTRYCRNHTQFCNLFRMPVLDRSLLGPLPMYTKEASAIRGFLSNRREFIQKKTNGESKRCVTRLPLFQSLFPHGVAAVLSGGRRVEAFKPPKYRSLPRYYHYSPSARFGLDARRGPDRVHQSNSGCRPPQTRRPFSQRSQRDPHPSPAR